MPRPDQQEYERYQLGLIDPHKKQIEQRSAGINQWGNEINGRKRWIKCGDPAERIGNWNQERENGGCGVQSEVTETV